MPGEDPKNKVPESRKGPRGLPVSMVSAVVARPQSFGFTCLIVSQCHRASLAILAHIMMKWMSAGFRRDAFTRAIQGVPNGSEPGVPRHMPRATGVPARLLTTIGTEHPP